LAALLRTQTTTASDEQGRVHQTSTFSVDQGNGTVSANSLTTNTWYDHRSDVIKTSKPSASWKARTSSRFSWLYLYQGGRYDTTSGQYNFRNRDPSPTVGRWMRQDPAGYAVVDTNLYGDEGRAHQWHRSHRYGNRFANQAGRCVISRVGKKVEAISEAKAKMLVRECRAVAPQRGEHLLPQPRGNSNESRAKMAT
jgi:RHS repeat-associated protein